MKPLRVSYCPAEKKPCIRWIEDVFKDCLCNINDEISFAFGVLSLISWAVAEIPQIVTNFSNKSANGVSLAFLSTWIVGDVLNLVGCILEPATLPTQFYTAVLYTSVTVILAIQCLYYNHFSKWWKPNKSEINSVKEETEPLQPKCQDRSKTTKILPVDVPYKKKFYFTSARSLAGSDTPPTKSSSYMKARSGPPVLEHDSSSEENDDDNEYVNIQPPIIKHVAAQPRPIPRPVGYGTFAATSANLPHLSRAFKEMVGGQNLSAGIVSLQELNESPYGQLLGWLMAAIYMGGRIPQIWLNIQRGSVEGLNPLMFVFALVANSTYVASILVRSIEWKVIKANMPWLLDAIVCVALDFFIIFQYIFYKYIKENKSRRSEHYVLIEADKVINDP
ncbi:vacuolar histidine transporter YPQ3-like isoform X1 [Primulina eburnea]|uniref:vacuolar histidine transporter YPQ3-like isoform X1 n=1 Tax=Primulina eburnea TaxID=1245227 RepID=UPI003C6CBA3C